jgi:hypothetical protein
VGEIGISRREFLYEINFWEALHIRNGYFKRHHPAWEQARLIAYYVRYCMGLAQGESPLTVKQFMPFSWESEKTVSRGPQLSEDERKQLEEDMKNFTF